MQFSIFKNMQNKTNKQNAHKLHNYIEFINSDIKTCDAVEFKILVNLSNVREYCGMACDKAVELMLSAVISNSV